MNQKNTIAAIALSFGFLVLWYLFVVPRFTPPPKPLSPEPAAVAASGPMAEKSAEMKPAHATPVIQAKDVTLRTAEADVVLSPLGGSVRSWILKLKGHEVDLVLNPSGTVEAVDAGSRTVQIKRDEGGSATFSLEEGTIIVRDEAGIPLADVRVGDHISIRNRRDLVSFPDRIFSVNVDGKGAVMQATLENGLRVTKTLTLSAQGYLNRLSYRFENPTRRDIEMKNWDWGWGPGIGTSPAERKENGGQIRALTMGRLRVTKVKENDHPEFGRWVGIDNRYFLVAFIPVTPHDTQLLVTGKTDTTQIHLSETTRVPAGQSVQLDYELYAGPKGYTPLKTYSRDLEQSVDFGIFSPLGKLILNTLYWLHNWTHNYGWSIVLLTLLLNVLLLPLTFKSFKATFAMKALQPKIAALQAKYKGDPKRLNVEMMNLYKTSGTNPFGGCLPMLLQLPIFWALFTTLRNAYELRGAPWIGWIHDLSAADPLHILPIVMGAGMFVQQRMSGAVTDPTQRQMMYIMPVMFTVMFFNFPSGLVLYWFTNSLITMTLQWTYTRNHTPSPS